jgi:tetratricopeptide (TPR) repeat protein
VAADDTDARLFEAMVRDGRQAYAAGDPERAAARLTEALALWYGRPLADVPPTPLVEAEAERLAELRLGAVELRITAELALGGHDQAVAELRRLLADHPLREGLWLLLMRALDGAGRHAEALEVYGQARDAISEQLGVDPGAELRQFHAELLAKDTAAPAGVITAGALSPPAEPAPEPRQAHGTKRASSSPEQLPADIADFTGRDEQVKRLSHLLSGAGASSDPGAVRIAVVAGAGGLGKTSLAVHAAHRVRRRFPDGQLYVDLLGATPAPLLPGDVLARFLRDLGVDGRDIPVDEDERAARYRTALARRRMLVVLDNARDAAQVRPLLPGTASSAVLVTTRSRMPDLASTKLVDLNVLDDDEALKLFVKVVGEERAAAEPEAFCLLGLWQGSSISSAAAAALFGVPEYAAEDVLEVLVDTHLLESVAADRYRFHDLLRVYAAERAEAGVPAGERAAAAARLLGWYMRSADAAATAVAPHRYNIPLDAAGDEVPARSFATSEEALAWYDDERANLVAATRQAAESRLHEIAWRLPAPLFQIFSSRGNWADCIATNRIALESARAAGNRQAEAWILNSLGDALGFTRHPEGIDCLERSLAIRREIGDRMGEAQAVNNLADAYHWLGRTDEALELYRRALELNRTVGYQLGEGIALVNLGWILVDLARAGEAVDYLLQARRAFAGIDYVDGVGYALHILGRCHLALGQDAEALGCLQEALASHRASGNRSRQAATLTSLGTAQSRLGRAAGARASWAEAAAIFTELGDSAEAEKVRAEQAASGIS